MPSRTAEFHPGEKEMHRILKSPHKNDPSSPGFPSHYGPRLLASPLVALGTLDKDGNPWTTIWGGERGFARQIAPDVIALQSAVARGFDPVFDTWWEGESQIRGDVVRPESLMSGLAIDLETRDRVKLGGRMVAGAVVSEEEVQIAVHVEESLGNCPKYLNKKEVVPHSIKDAKLESSGFPLLDRAKGVVDRADLFFMSSSHEGTMDTNIRGGSPGFMRVLRNDEGGVSLVYPEYSGNRLYQTLGNLKLNPKVGIVIPDFHTGDVLYVTGKTSILVGQDASSVMPKSKLAIQIDVTQARFVTSGLPFRASVIDYSPYNPTVRYLVNEHPPPGTSDAPSAIATLIKREPLTPTISRFTFKLEPSGTWVPGQHVTFDFSGELDHGYSHMRDDDPQALNDDFVRTFTVSNVPDGKGDIQITARKHGSSTALLGRHNLRVPLEIPVMGFGGEEKFRMPVIEVGSESVFIAGGVGITPLLAQAAGVLKAGVSLTLIWSLRGEDLGLAVDSFARIEGLSAVTRLFVTGEVEDDVLEKVRTMGAMVETRRVEEGDVKAVKGKFYLCAQPALLKRVNEWLKGEDVVWEDFGY